MRARDKVVSAAHGDNWKKTHYPQTKLPKNINYKKIKSSNEESVHSSAFLREAALFLPAEVARVCVEASLTLVFGFAAAGLRRVAFDAGLTLHLMAVLRGVGNVFVTNLLRTSSA